MNYDNQLEEIYAANHLQQSWGEHSNTYGHHHEHAQSQGFFQPLDCNSTLQIGLVFSFFKKKLIQIFMYLRVFFYVNK